MRNLIEPFTEQHLTEWIRTEARDVANWERNRDKALRKLRALDPVDYKWMLETLSWEDILKRIGVTI